MEESNKSEGQTEWLSPGQFGTMDNEDSTAGQTDKDDNNDGQNAGAQMNEAANDKENNGDAVENTAGDAADDAGNAVGNAVEDAGKAAKDAVDDVADGVGDAIDNLGGGSFDRYEDAREYLLDKLKKDNATASYEVREDNKDLISYNSNDSGAQGYQFAVYETDGNEKIGTYYVDKENGKIYRYMGKGAIEAY